MTDGVGAVYSGAATFGKFSAIVGGIIGTLIALIIGGFGIYIIVESLRRTMSIRAKITKSTCGGSSSSNQCEITVAYPDNSSNSDSNAMCSKVFTVDNNSKYEEGKSVIVYYDPSDPCNTGSLDSQEQNAIVGGIMIFVALFIIIIVWLVVYLTYKYKFFAAAEGVGTVIRLI